VIAASDLRSRLEHRRNHLAGLRHKTSHQSVLDEILARRIHQGAQFQYQLLQCLLLRLSGRIIRPYHKLSTMLFKGNESSGPFLATVNQLWY
jgi:hypothetical protein